MTDDFPARLFPASFTLLYCPYQECPYEVPFKDPSCLLQHVESAHGLLVAQPAAVLPFLDRYLSKRLLRDGEGGGMPSSTISAVEDARLRNELQQERLQEILNIQEQERNNSHRTGRHCLFCNTHLPDYYELFAHMFSAHSFNIGHLDNLVMVAEFLDTLQRKLDGKVCIYCEGAFPSMPTLKKHLKNKGHYRIHPRNHIYDKHYIVNYLQPGKLYDPSQDQTTKSERGGEEEEGEARGDAEWETLGEEIGEETMCLFCSHVSPAVSQSVTHMHAVHDFDWDGLTAGLGDLDTIKLVNYLRNCQIDVRCPYCAEGPSFEETSELLAHLCEHRPFLLPPAPLLNDSQNLFSVFDDDPMLWALGGSGDCGDDDDGSGKGDGSDDNS